MSHFSSKCVVNGSKEFSLKVNTERTKSLFLKNYTDYIYLLMAVIKNDLIKNLSTN